MDRQSLMKLISSIHTMIANGSFSDLDDTLIKVDISQDPVVLITYLRSSFSVKDKLKNWSALRDKVALELIRRDLDVKAIMVGL